ncbi:MAG: DUF6089 family protein [Chitinophagaceae bacterium]|nr:DUF6089 family protein [Chitinophagaceae bacterium]
MKRFLIACAVLVQTSHAQEWQAEFLAGAALYNGDLSQKALNVRAIRPTFNLNIKYEFYYLVLRAGISYTRLVGSDKYNKDPYLRNRNLSFYNNVWEASLVAEYNLVEPELFYAYPYIMAGVGVFRHDPYAFDNEGNKVRLQPLNTEGQGLPQYPKRKKYSLTQACLPVGIGWKWRVNEKFDLAYELSYRLLFTDYLDDVSTTYVRTDWLRNEYGPKSAEMSNRATPVPGNNHVPGPGDQRGNPDVKDNYITSGVKLIMHLGKRKN